MSAHALTRSKPMAPYALWFLLTVLPFIVVGVILALYFRPDPATTEVHPFWLPEGALVFDRNNVSLDGNIATIPLEEFQGRNLSDTLVLVDKDLYGEDLSLQYFAKNPEGGTIDAFQAVVPITHADMGQVVGDYQVEGNQLRVRIDVDILGTPNAPGDLGLGLPYFGIAIGTALLALLVSSLAWRLLIAR